MKIKMTKRIIAFLLSVLLVAGGSVSVFAEDEGQADDVVIVETEDETQDEEPTDDAYIEVGEGVADEPAETEAPETEAPAEDLPLSFGASSENITLPGGEKPEDALTAEGEVETLGASDADGEMRVDKYIEAGSETGQFVLTLEAYATGENIVVESVKPADIVVVVDQSGSMLQKLSDTKLTKSDLVNNAQAQKNAGHGLYYLAYGNSTVCFLFYQNNKWYYYDTYLLKETVTIDEKTGSYCYEKPLKDHPRYDYYKSQGKGENDYLNGGWDNYVPSFEYIKSHLSEVSDGLWNIFETNGIWQTRYGATYDALLSFVDNIHESGDDHRVAIVGFGGDYEVGSALYINGNRYSYINGISYDNYTNALVSVKTEDGKNSIKSSIDALHTNQRTTHHHAGIIIANDIYKNSPITPAGSRDRITIIFSDGATSEENKAEEAILATKDTYGSLVYAVSTAGAEVSFMTELATGPEYSLIAKNADDLLNAFGSISSDLSGTNVTFHEESVLKDIISSDFKLPDGTDEDDIQVYSVKHLGDWEFEIPSDSNKFTSADVEIEEDGKTILVKGFNYAENFVALATDGKEACGYKLVVKIPIEFSESLQGGATKVTNGVASGVYPTENSTIGKAIIFPQPVVDTPANIVIKKVVDNNSSDNTAFTFDIKYSELTGYTSTEDKKTLIATSIEKIDSAVLSNGGQKSISGIAPGTEIKIKEQDKDNYKLTKVRVTYQDGSSVDIQPQNGEYHIEVQDGMIITFVNTLQRADITISKSVNAESFDPNQVFVFEIKGVEGTATDYVNCIVTVVGNESVKITELLIGKYIITEITDWSWRYYCSGIDTNNNSGTEYNNLTREQKVNSTQITLGGEGTTVTFTNVKDKTEWLSGDCYAENAWGDDGVSCTSTPEADVKTDPVENANLYYYYKDPRYALAAV